MKRKLTVILSADVALSKMVPEFAFVREDPRAAAMFAAAEARLCGESAPGAPQSS